jgi:serine/threonine-protein kinase
VNQITGVTQVTEVQAGKGPARDTVLLGKYRVESTLGFGGMGLVIRANNIALNERVAIKVLREDVQLDEDNITRFVREAKNAVRLKSEHVARIHDVGKFEDGRPYMVMELLEGLDLGKILLDEGRIEPIRAVDLVLQACDAIAEAHSLGIIHRDVKPTNLFVTKRRDGTDLLKVLDFGISKAVLGQEMSLTQTSSMLGTPAYMSPEQMRSARTADPRSDIWSLGTVLYELVEGRLPFDAENFAELCVMVATEPPAPMKHAPQLSEIVMRALEKNAEDRFQSVGELAQDLITFSSDEKRATRQVARISRMLAKAPDLRLTSDAAPKRLSTPYPRASALSTMSATLRRGATTHPIQLVAALVLLFGIGIAAGLWVTSGEEQPSEPQVEEEEPGPEPSPTETAPAEPPPPASEVPAHVDTPIAIDAGVEKTVRAAKPPEKPRPPRKPTVRKPAVTKPPVSKPLKPPVVQPPPPKKKCDPFANPKGCT